MKVSLSWLKDYVPISGSATDLAHKLAMAGNEVEGIDRIGAIDPLVIVGELTSVEKHPNADRLSLVNVNFGSGSNTVVTGAPGLAVGMRVPYAPVGATLIDGHNGERMTLKPAKLRGIESAGMVCSAMELGLGDDHSGILALDRSIPLGTPIAELYGDTILDVKATANRPDILAMVGVAWEVAALTGTQVIPPRLDAPTSGDPARVAIEIQDAALCARYSAIVVRGVTVEPSPRWLQDRLIAAGMRPISNVVDITNYVMLELGQPLHAFDAATIGDRIVIRRARDGERLRTLDDVDRALDPSMLVIADTQQPIALAGVMGGLATEVSDTTRDVLIESANFHNITIRRTAQALKLRSEASARFEKGINPALTVRAAQRAAKLMADIAGGAIAPGVIDAYPGEQPVEQLRLTEDAVERVLGIRWSQDTLAATFRALGFGVAEGDGLLLTPPDWRTDIRIPEDLIEEAARIIGYGELPATALRGAIPATPPNPVDVVRDRVRDLLAGMGMHEIVSYALIGRDLLGRIGEAPDALAILAPMSSEQEVLRPSLRPGMLKILSENIRHETDGVALFEVGPVYLPRQGDLPEEPQLLAGALTGRRAPVGWLTPGADAVDFFDAKGIVEALAARLGVRLSFARTEDAFYTPGRAAEIRRDGQPIGTIGEVYPPIADRFDLKAAVYFELRLAALAETPLVLASPVTRLPDTVQDIAIVVDTSLEAERIREVLAGGKWVREVRLFDVYSGPGMPPGKRSLAFSLRFQAPDRTLTEEEASRVRLGLVERLRRQFGAELRA